jgi:1-acyl-sn-glycerol-3-phosphate acyltransferase
MPIVYVLSRGICGLICRLLFRYRVHHADRVPQEGACIIAANHASYLDPPLVGMAAKHRRVRFMARDTLYKNRAIRWMFDQFGCVAIDRTKGDVAALRAGIRVLRNGEVLGLFPEGTRTLDGELQPAKGGVGFLIAKGKAPVVPVYIRGSYEAMPKGRKGLRFPRIDIYFGHPMAPETLSSDEKGRSQYTVVGQKVMDAIAQLKAEAQKQS